MVLWVFSCSICITLSHDAYSLASVVLQGGKAMAKELSGGTGLFQGFYILKNVIISFLATGVLMFLGALAVTYFSVSEATIDAVVMVLTAVCVAWGGFRASRHLGKQGLFSGALSGLTYMVFLYFIGAMIFGELTFAPQSLLSVAVGVGCGAIGGIIGVNTQKRRRK